MALVVDSTLVINAIAQHTGEDTAKVIFGVIGAVISVLWPVAAKWANDRKTTWYWNPITKKFVLDRVSKILGAIFGRGVNDSKVQYEDNLPPEAVEELRKMLAKKYPCDILPKE